MEQTLDSGIRGVVHSYRDTAALVFETTARNSESVIGIAATAYPSRPLILLAMIIGPALELPILLALTKVLLQIKPRWRPGHSPHVNNNMAASPEP